MVKYFLPVSIKFSFLTVDYSQSKRYKRDISDIPQRLYSKTMYSEIFSVTVIKFVPSFYKYSNYMRTERFFLL